MDVVLLKDIEQLGTEGTVVRVKPGFARNYLIPRGLAVLAIEQQLRAIEELKRQRSRKIQRAQADAETLKQQLERRPLTLTLNLGADWKSFGSVTTHDILEALQREGLSVEKHAIQLKQPIKTLGTHDVPVRVHPDVTAVVKLSVVKQ